MKKKIIRTTNVERRRALALAVLPSVRKLVRKFDLAAVQAAVKAIYLERTAERELHEAEKRVQTLKNKLGA